MDIHMNVNGQTVSLSVEPRRLLADALRDDLKLTGTKVGCSHGVCGTCTIHVDGVARRSCLMLAAQADGADIRTIEGVADPDGTLSSLQNAFWEQGGLQCGFCTPGMVMTALGVLERNEAHDEVSVRRAMSGNLCRCTGYDGIVAAVVSVANRSGTAS